MFLTRTASALRVLTAAALCRLRATRHRGPAGLLYACFPFEKVVLTEDTARPLCLHLPCFGLDT